MWMDDALRQKGNRKKGTQYDHHRCWGCVGVVAVVVAGAVARIGTGVGVAGVAGVVVVVAAAGTGARACFGAGAPLLSV